MTAQTWEMPSRSGELAVVRGQLLVNDQAYDFKDGPGLARSKDGQARDISVKRTGHGTCVPATIAGDGRVFIYGRDGGGMIVSVRETASQYTRIPYNAMRAVASGTMPANGMFYAGQNNCTCVPACLRGVVAFGHVSARAEEVHFKRRGPWKRGRHSRRT